MTVNAFYVENCSEYFDSLLALRRVIAALVGAQTNSAYADQRLQNAASDEVFTVF